MLMTPPPYNSPVSINRQQVGGIGTANQTVPGIQGAPVIRPGLPQIKGLPAIGGQGGTLGTGGSGMGNPLNQGQNPMMANILRR